MKKKRKPEYLATFHIIVLVSYSKPINGLIAATSGALVCWRQSLLLKCKYILQRGHVYCPLIHGISFIHSFGSNKHIWDRALRWRGGCDVILSVICLRCFIRPSFDRLFIDYILCFHLFIYLFIYCSYIFKTWEKERNRVQGFCHQKISYFHALSPHR